MNSEVIASILSQLVCRDQPTKNQSCSAVIVPLMFDELYPLQIEQPRLWWQKFVCIQFAKIFASWGNQAIASSNLQRNVQRRFLSRTLCEVNELPKETYSDCAKLLQQLLLIQFGASPFANNRKSAQWREGDFANVAGEREVQKFQWRGSLNELWEGDCCVQRLLNRFCSLDRENPLPMFLKCAIHFIHPSQPLLYLEREQTVSGCNRSKSRSADRIFDRFFVRRSPSKFHVRRLKKRWVAKAADKFHVFHVRSSDWSLSMTNMASKGYATHREEEPAFNLFFWHNARLNVQSLRPNFIALVYVFGDEILLQIINAVEYMKNSPSKNALEDAW